MFFRIEVAGGKNLSFSEPCPECPQQNSKLGPAPFEHGEDVLIPGSFGEPVMIGEFIILVGGLVAISYFPIYWVSNHPN